MKKIFKSSMVFLSAAVFSLGFFILSRAEPAGEENRAEESSREEISAYPVQETENQEDVEDWDDELSEELLSEEDSQEEIEALIEQYLEGMDLETIPGGKQEFEKVNNPEMSAEWDREGRMINRFPNQGYFIINVPNGMLSSEPVELSLSSGCMAIIEHDGVSQTLTSSRRFTEAGIYHVSILSYQAPEEALQDEDYTLYETSRYFTILDRTAGIGAISAPEGFDITKVTRDGQELPVENPRCFFLAGDGLYTIRYTAKEDYLPSDSVSQSPEKIQLETTLIQDATAPFLSFSQELENGESALGMLEFYPSEENCRIYMTYNGEQGYAVSNQLTVAGYYRLEIEDAAGNRREYRLRIRPNYQLFDARVIAAGVILLIAVMVWMFLQRRNMQVL